MKQTKRLLCLALSLIMLLSLFPASALADEPVNLSASEEAQDDDSEASNDDAPVGDGVLDVPNDDATLDDEDETPLSTQDDEDAPEPVRVVFVCTPEETVVTVYDPAHPDENGEPTAIDPEEDGSWLLVPGTYLYDAECEGYVSAEKVEFEVTAEKADVQILLPELNLYFEDAGLVSVVNETAVNALTSGSNVITNEQIEAAIAWAVEKKNSHSNAYGPWRDDSGTATNLCAAFVRDAYRNTSNIPVPSSNDATGLANQLLIHTDSNPPRGALVFWNAGAYGHAAISLGDGRVIHSWGKDKDNNIVISESIQHVTQWTNNGNASYRGWAAPAPGYILATESTPTTLTVSADNAIYVTPDSARINGTISFPTSLRPTAWGIDVGSSAGNVTNVPFAEGYSNSISSTQTSPYNISFNFSKMAASNPLQAGTKYYYRFWVKYTEDGQTKYAHSEIKNFTTGTSVSISLADSTMTQIGSTNATLGAVVTISGASSTDLKKAGGRIGIQLYTASGSYLGSASDNAPLNLNSNGTINTWYTVGTGKDVNVALTPGTQYKYRFFVNLDSNTNYYSSYKTFTTESGGSTTPTVAKTGTYNSHYYERYDSSITWTEAKAFCQSKGGHLVTITSEAENAWITNTLLSGCGKNVYFIGGTDTSGSWKWVTGETFSYTNWDQDRPEPTNKADEDYAAIMGKQVGANKSPGEWIDIFNDGDTNASYVGYELENCGFICEYEPYTISYNANGGTGAPANQTKTHGTALTLSSTKPTRANASAGSYTVTLNANGGSVSPSSLTANRTTSYSFKNWNTAQNGSGTSYNSGASYTANAAATLYAQWNSSTATASVTLPTPTRSGYSFQGWATSSSATSGVTGSYTPTGNVTLYATWKADIYTVSYNANGGTGAPANQTKTHGVALTLSSTKPTRANASAGNYTVTLNANGGSVGTSSLTANRTTSYSFKNWNTVQNGSGTSYASGASYTANAAATLYAQWNSSTATASVTLPTPTRSGYSFQGWATSSGATSGVTGSYTPSADVTLYAAWQPNDLVVQYHSNGGTIGENNYNFSLDDNGNILLDGSTTISTLHYGTTYANGLMNAHTFALSREGYQFVGWCLSADGSTTVFDQDEPLNAETIVPGLANGNATAKLYAIWEANTYTISYNANGGADAPDAQTKTHGVALTLSSTKPTRANASAGNYTITLNANGGSVGTSSLTAARTTSYSFKNWNTAQNGSGTSYNSGASYTANTDATLYAQWNSNTTTAAVTLPTPTREGYSFLGWAESADAQSGMTGSYTPSADITLYAIWKENAPPISPDAPSFHVAEVNGRAGGTVTVPVTIKNNPGIALFKVNVEYDENILEWTGISHKALDGFWSAEVGKPVVWVGNGDAEYEDDGEIFTLTFAVKENIEPQTTSIHLSYDPDDIQSWNEELIGYENVAFAVIEGKVNIVSTVSLTGTALSWNNNADVEVLLYTADTEDSVLNAAAQSGDYSGALKTGVLGEITASGKQYACTFTVSDIEPGTYKLLVMKPGKYVPVIRTVELNEDTTLDPITLWLYGDVTADGKVNGTDALQIKRYFADISSVFTKGTEQEKAERLIAANVTAVRSGDDKVNGTDALQIQRYFADISSVFMYMR